MHESVSLNGVGVTLNSITTMDPLCSILTLYYELHGKVHNCHFSFRLLCLRNSAERNYPGMKVKLIKEFMNNFLW